MEYIFTIKDKHDAIAEYIPEKILAMLQRIIWTDLVFTAQHQTLLNTQVFDLNTTGYSFLKMLIDIGLKHIACDIAVSVTYFNFQPSTIILEFIIFRDIYMQKMIIG